MDRKLKKRIEELVKEKISIIPYDPNWVIMFEKESAFLRDKLPNELVRKIEHFGSTAIPGISAKPIIDILVEITNYDETKKRVVPILETEGYEYFWRSSIGNQPPFYVWFIKRNSEGKRTYHIHMVEADSELWDRLYFRDYLKEFPEKAKSYDKLKRVLSEKHPNDRIKYTQEKSNFIISITRKAKEYYKSLK